MDVVWAVAGAELQSSCCLGGELAGMALPCREKTKVLNYECFVIVIYNKPATLAVVRTLEQKDKVNY